MEGHFSLRCLSKVFSPSQFINLEEIVCDYSVAGSSAAIPSLTVKVGAQLPAIGAEGGESIADVSFPVVTADVLAFFKQ